MVKDKERHEPIIKPCYVDKHAIWASKAKDSTFLQYVATMSGKGGEYEISSYIDRRGIAESYHK